MPSLNQKTNYLALTGSEAVAEAMRQINPEVMAAYPITPQTLMIERFSEFVANGLVDTKMLNVESEHSALSAAIGAAASGARTMTATSSQGLALMAEMCYIASGLRLPIVMNIATRALSAPLNIHCDHSDVMMLRDSGWIQIYCETAQEVYDNNLIALRVAEHKDVCLPVMTMQDGFITSYAVENVLLLEDKEVKKFIGEVDSFYSLLDIENPVTIGAIDLFDYYFEHKRQQEEGMENARKIISQIDEEFYALSGRRYHFIEEYKTTDAEFILVAIGSTAGTAKEVVDTLREGGVKAGVLKIRIWRPFPEREIQKALCKAKAIAILDRAYSSGTFGPVFTQVRSALYDLTSKPRLQNYIYGLGGRDISVQNIEKVFEEMQQGQFSEGIKYIGLRE